MLSRYAHHGLTWVDLESPTHEEIHAIMAEFSIDPLVAEELLLPSMKPRAEFYGAYAYFVMHFPALRHSHTTSEQEIDFVIGHNYLITTHYDTVDPLHKFAKIFEVNSILDKSNIGEHAGFLFFYMLKKLYKAIDHEVEYVKHDMTHIEEHIFSGHEVPMVRAISESARDLLNLRQTIEPHREILHTLETEGAQFFGGEFLPYLRTLNNEYYRVHNHIMRNTESMHELRETNNALLATKEGETMRVLTIMALLTFPLSLLVSVFAMDTTHNPIRGLPFDFWIIVGIVAFTGGSMVLYFKHKGWL